MERNIRVKVNHYLDDFRENIQQWMSTNQAAMTLDGQNKNLEFLQYINDFPYIEFSKEDFQKRKRVKNNVPDYNRCIALKCNGERCSRKQKDSSTNFCGTHMKGSPYGTIEEQSIAPKQQKVQLWLEDINGISRYIDKEHNIYSSEDIIRSSSNPRIIATYTIDEEGHYTITRT